MLNTTLVNYTIWKSQIWCLNTFYADIVVERMDLTHLLSLAFFLWHIGEQNSPRCNAVTTAKAVPTSTHNLCFGSKIRKIGISLYTPVFIIKVEYMYKGVYITQTCFPDGVEYVICLIAGFTSSTGHHW